jgi:Mg/Co/Ni transporter MgtE
MIEINLQSLEKLAPTDLATLINELIKNDFSRLVQLLYRIDVSEQKLKNILQAHPDENAGELIATVIIERLAATKKARESFKTPPGIEDMEERL